MTVNQIQLVKGARRSIGSRQSDRRWSHLWYPGKLTLRHHKDKPWVLLDVHRGMCEASYASLKSEGVDCEAHFDHPHISVLRPEDIEKIRKDHGDNWRGLLQLGEEKWFKIVRMVSLIPKSWEGVDRVWFLECGSPDLETYRLGLGLPARPVDTESGHEFRFHVTFALRRNTEQRFRETFGRDAEQKIASTLEEAAFGIGKAAELDMGEAIKTTMGKMELDPDVTESTLGERHDRVTVPLLLRTTDKLLKISRGEADVDDRDSLAYQSLYGPEDHFAERIVKDAGMVGRKLLWKSSLKGTVKSIPSGALTPQMHHVLLKSGMAAPLEEINPLESLDQIGRVVRLGEGGLSDLNSVPDEARGVQPSHFGVLDPVRTPESASMGIDSRVSYRAVKGHDGQFHFPVIDVKTGKEVYITPKMAAKSVIAFPGEYTKGSEFPRAMTRSNELGYADRKDINYELPSPTQKFAISSNLIPLVSTAKSARLMMGSKYPLQSLPLREREAPLVQSLGPDGRSFQEIAGRWVGAVRSNVGGTVVSVEEGKVTVRSPDGRLETQELSVNMPHNRKSVTADTEIFILRGGKVTRVLIGDYVWQAGDKTLSIDPATCASAWMQITGYVRHVNDKRLFRVTTDCGRVVDVTEDHSLLTLDAEGRLAPIYPLDCVVNRTRLPVAMVAEFAAESLSSDKLSADHGRLAGLYLSEGHCPEQKGLIMIAVKPSARVEQVRNLLMKLSRSTPYLGSGGVCITDHDLRRWLVEEFGEYSHGKRIPDRVFCAPKEFVLGLIEGYFAGDGCLWEDQGGGLHLSAVSVSRSLRDGLVDVLSRLGIFSTLWDAPRSHLNPAWRDGYGLRVIRGHIDRLSKWFFYDDRQAKLEQLLEGWVQRASKFEQVPVDPAYRKCLYREFGDAAPAFIHKTARQGSVAKARLTACTGVYGKWGRSDVMWSKIVDISPIERQEYVYDLEVRESEAFAVCHGLVVHNTLLHNTPAVKVGDKVAPGGLLAYSNYTDPKGVLAVGANFRTAYMPWRGLNFEDAVVISESASKRLTSEHMEQTDVSPDDTKFGLKPYVSMFPGKFPKAKLQNLTEEGVVKPGTVVRYGDPLVLALKQSTYDAAHRGHKPMFSDASQTWEHDYEGVVTDAVKTDDGGWNVIVKSYAPAQEADKLAGSFGDKGVIAKVVPDNLMPRGADGKPMEILLNPQGIVTRGNTAQIYEAWLGKVARKKGEPYRVPGFMDGGIRAFAMDELRKADMKGFEDLEDPETGRKIRRVATGERFIMKLHHTASSKEGARDVGGYTSEGLPSRGGEQGSKRVAFLEQLALLSHGVPEVLRSAQVVRGQKNPEYWQAVRAGNAPPPPKRPFVYDKFHAFLKAGGLDVQRKGNTIHLFALTDKLVDEMASGTIASPETVTGDKLDEVKGGLFDRAVTGGHHGNKWAKIDLAEPLPNPVMEDSVRRLLGLTVNGMEEVIAGKRTLNGRTGGQALLEALKGINRTAEEDLAKDTIRNSGSQAKRDDAVKRLGVLTGLRRMGLDPQDLMMTKVPVLPPAMRPITKFNNMTMTADPNYLYRDLMFANQDLDEARKTFTDEGAGEERLRLYKAFRAVTGLGDPVQAKTLEKGVSGVLTHVFGKNGPKTGMFVRRVLGSPVDMVGRATIIPDPDLGMDEVGLPEEQAWTIYRPFVMRRMIRQGMPMVQAAREVLNRTDQAHRALEQETKDRPLLINRAPTLHRYGFLAAFPRLVKGNSLRIPPVTVKGYNADFDGNCVEISTKVTCKFRLTEPTLLSMSLEEAFEKEYKMKFSVETTVLAKLADGVLVSMPIGQIPRIESTLQHDRNGARVYQVPEGISVWTYDHKEGRAVFAPVSKLTLEDKVESVLVTTRGGLEVRASTNESLCVYDSDKEQVVKMAPKDAVGKLCPVLSHVPLGGEAGDYEFGWMLGAFVSDGFVQTFPKIGYAKLSDAHRQRFVKAATKHEGRRDIAVFTYKGEGEFGSHAKLHCDVPRTHEVFASCYVDYAKMPDASRSALRKTLPDISGFSEDARLGLLAGLLDGDGSVSLSADSEVGGKSQINLSFSTSSPFLRDAVLLLARTLNVRANYSVCKPSDGRPQRFDNYVVFFSAPDVRRIASRLKMTDPEKAAVMRKLATVEHMKDDRDIVPMPQRLMALAASKIGPCGSDSKLTRSMATIKSARKGYVSREMAWRALRLLEEARIDCDGWRKILEASGVRWDLVASLGEVESLDVADLVVESTQVFATSQGFVIWDTMTFHVTTTDEEIREAKEKMLPSVNLLAVKNRQVHQLPNNEFLLGLYLATAARKGQEPRVFASKADAMAAYRRGEIDIDDRIEFRGDR